MGRLATLMALGTIACGGHATTTTRRDWPAPVAVPPPAIASSTVSTLSTVSKTDDPPPATRRDRRARTVQIPDDVIQRAVHRRRPSLYRCYHAERRADPSITTMKIPLTLRINAGGTVDSARIVAAPRMQGCIDAVIRRVRVRPAPGAPVDVDVPLVFSAS